MRSAGGRTVVSLLAATAVVAGAVAATSAGRSEASVASAASASAVAAGSAAAAGSARYQPNVVTIVADDLDSSLVRYMPHVKKLASRGADFRRHFVIDSLCCSSRASFLTGMYPHNSKVYNNIPGRDHDNPVGGYAAWMKADNETKTFAYDITRQTRYRTGFFGKYINQYPGDPGSPAPAGWGVFHALTGNFYSMLGYSMTSLMSNPAGGRFVTSRRYGTKPKDYSTDVLRRMTVRHLKRAERRGAPYLVQVTPTSVHARKERAVKKQPLFPPAKRDLPRKGKKAKKKNPRLAAGDCGTVRCTKVDIRKQPSFNASRGATRPRYEDGRPGRIYGETKKLKRKQIKSMQRHYRNRVRMAQSLDDLVGAVMRTVGPDTYIVFTSDNGYHLGHRRLRPGKSSAYDTDIRVPLIIAGPGVVRGKRYQVVQSIDLAPTFEQIAGVTPSARRDGRSLVPILRNRKASWSRYAFVEHTRPPRSSLDPDNEGLTPVMPSYVAIRSAGSLLVRYDTADGDPSGYTYEYYTGLTKHRAWEKTNRYRPTDATMRRLKQRLEAFVTCAGAQCRTLAR